MRAAMSMAPASSVAMPPAAMGIPSFSIMALNRSRSSAMSITAGGVPRMRTPASSSWRAMFSGVCPPNWQITPMGCSFS